MRSAVPLVVAALGALGALALIQQGTRPGTLLFGGCLVLIGLPLLMLSRRHLGRAFAVTPQAKVLVTEGVYGRIPHPMYVFLDVTLLGVIIMLQQAWLLVLWTALVTLQAWQAQREARVLEQAFGDSYREYRKRTWW